MFHRVLLLALAASTSAGCSLIFPLDRHRGGPDSGVGIDSGTPVDGGPQFDGNFDAGAGMAALLVTVAGTGAGSVTVEPGAMVCSTGTCTYNLPIDTPVTLTGAASGGSGFSGWTGGNCTGTVPCSFTLSSNTSVTATFVDGQYTLTLDFAGGGSGSVTIEPNGIVATASGTHAIASGAVITLRAESNTGFGFAGWSGDLCTGFDDCSFTMTGDINATATFERANRMFVTSTQQAPGALGGLNGADTICQNRANAAGLTNSANFHAFLGSRSGASPVTAWTRLGSYRGWVRVDGLPFGDSVASMMAGQTFYPTILMETNTPLPAGQQLAVTGANGGTGEAICNDWGSTVSGMYVVAFGSPDAQYLSWVTNGTTNCASATMRLYCFELTTTTRVRPMPPATFRRAFLSANQLAGNETIAVANTHCQNEADAAGLPGTYRALLAGNGTSAAAGFTSAGATWYRPDNVRLAATALGFLNATGALEASISVRADGVTHEGALTWGGAATVAQAGSSASTCGGWTLSSGTSAVRSYPIKIQSNWFGEFSNGDCSQSHRFYCLQE